MTEPVIVDQVEQGLGRLLSQWDDKPNVQGLVQSLQQILEDINVAYGQLLNERDIYTAIGINLDILGLIIGELRKGRNDDDYREALFTRIAINASDGTGEAILEVLSLLTQTDDVNLWEYPDASVHLYSTGVIPSTIVNIANGITLAGVNARFIFSDPEIPCFIAPSLIGEPDNIITQASELIIDNNGNYLVSQGYTPLDLVGTSNDRAYLPNVGETINPKPLANILVNDTPTLTISNIVSDVGDNIIDNNLNQIIAITEV